MAEEVISIDEQLKNVKEHITRVEQEKEFFLMKAEEKEQLVQILIPKALNLLDQKFKTNKGEEDGTTVAT